MPPVDPDLRVARALVRHPRMFRKVFDRMSAGAADILMPWRMDNRGDWFRHYLYFPDIPAARIVHRARHFVPARDEWFWAIKSHNQATMDTPNSGLGHPENFWGVGHPENFWGVPQEFDGPAKELMWQIDEILLNRKYLLL